MVKNKSFRNQQVLEFRNFGLETLFDPKPAVVDSVISRIAYGPAQESLPVKALCIQDLRPVCRRKSQAKGIENVFSSRNWSRELYIFQFFVFSFQILSFQILSLRIFFLQIFSLQ